MREKFTGQNAVMLLIDHQVGTMGWVGSTTFDEMKKNAILLAKAAKILNMPVILTSSMEEAAQGPLLPELAEILPAQFNGRIKRAGIVNAMDDKNFADAVKSTGRKKVVIAGVTNDVCTVYPALSLKEDGYEVHVVADAGGSPSSIGEDMALRRMENAGVVLLGTNQFIAGVAGSWATPEGKQLSDALQASLGG